MPSEAFKSWWTKFGETGDICPIQLGCTRQEIKSLFGEPDTVGGTSRRHKTPAIWKYGELEFHFGKGTDELSLIYSDTEDGTVKICIPRRSKLES